MLKKNDVDKSSSTDVPEDRATRKKRQLLTLSVDEKAELIAAKSKAAKLEVQLKSTESEKQRFDIESEKKRKLQAEKVARDQEEIDVLRRKYKKMVEAKETAEADLAALETTHKEVKTELEDRIDSLEKENQKVNNLLEVSIVSNSAT